MAARFFCCLTLLCLLPSLCFAIMNSGERQALLDLKQMLENPSQLSNWDSQTDFCNLPPSLTVLVACEGGYVTHLQIVGDRGGPNAGTMLSGSFSFEALMLQLSNFSSLKTLQLTSLGLWGPLSSKLGRLPNLQVLNLSSNFLSGVLPNRLMSLQNLQILQLNDNLLNGTLPQRWDSLPSLTTLSLSNNRVQGTLPHSLFSISGLKTLVLEGNLFSGPIPDSLSTAYSLQALSIAGNQLSGNLPDLRNLTNLLALNLQNNQIGPQFPLLGPQLLYLALGKNKLQGPIPSYIQIWSQLQQLDLSSNLLSGVPPASLFTLPNMRYLDVAMNKLSGGLPGNLTLPSGLKLLDISDNLLTGHLPLQLMSLASSQGAGVSIRFQGNCLSTTMQPQNPFDYCQNAALASGLNPRLTGHNDSSSSKRRRLVVLAGIAGGILGICLATLLLLFVVVRRIKNGHASKSSASGSPCMNNKSVAVSSELLSNARYISRTMKLGTLGTPHFRAFSMDELYKATDYFHESTRIGEGSRGKVYKGQLDDGSLVVIKRLSKDVTKGCSNLKSRLEILGKCRHQHLVSLLGYNLSCEDSNAYVQTGFQVCLVYEYVSNRTLRTKIAGKGHEGFGWLHRLLVLIGAAKGIQFLHSGLVPGVYDNDIKTTNILLDQNLVPKVSDYGLVMSADNVDHHNGRSRSNANSLSGGDKNRKKLSDKRDIYNYGLVLLEVLIGRPPSMDAAGGWKDMKALMGEEGPMLEAVDPRIVAGCNMESLTTVVEITEKCLCEDPILRPSMEDVLWNLQYALQVQDAYSNGGSQEDGVLQDGLSGEMPSSKGGRSRRNSLNHMSKASSNEEDPMGGNKPSSPISDFFR